LLGGEAARLYYKASSAGPTGLITHLIKMDCAEGSAYVSVFGAPQGCDRLALIEQEGDMAGIAPAPEPIGARTNPEQRLPNEVVEAMEARTKAQYRLLSLENEFGRASELNQEYGNAQREMYVATLEPLKVDAAKAFDRLKNVREAHNAKVATALKSVIEAKQRFTPGVVLEKIDWRAVVEPQDHNFWWSHSNWHMAAGGSFQDRDDGLHFFGGPSVNNWNGERHESFGVVARFALSPNRWPTTASGRFVSRPFVELFGGVVAHAPMWDLLEGHGQANCELFLRHRLFQFGFGPTGPVESVRGEAVESGTWHIRLQDLGASRNLGLPGHKDLPEISFAKGSLTPADTLWAELEIRFDIYIKSAGALVWCDPEVLVRTFQWPLIAQP
jgi:hypothetical protein